MDSLLKGKKGSEGELLGGVGGGWRGAKQQRLT